MWQSSKGRFSIIKIKLTDNLSPTQLKTSHKVGPLLLFNTDTSYVFCLGSTARAVKLHGSVSVTYLWLVVSISSIKFQFI